jgi:hypothetical protein
MATGHTAIVTGANHGIGAASPLPRPLQRFAGQPI